MKRYGDFTSPLYELPPHDTQLIITYLSPKDMQSTVSVNKSWNIATFKAIFTKVETFAKKLDLQLSYKNDSQSLIDIKISLLTIKENLLVSETKLPSEEPPLPPFFENLYELAPLYIEFTKMKKKPDTINRNLTLEKLFIELTKNGCIHVVQNYISEISLELFREKFTFITLIESLCHLKDFNNALLFTSYLTNDFARKMMLGKVNQLRYA